MTPQEQIAQAAIDLIAWFLLPFAFMLAVEWVVGLFRYDKR